MDAGVTFHKRVRFIFGTDEETLWRCINCYKEKEELPDMGFSPDSRFPLVYAEKGLLQLHLEGKNESGLRLSGGSAFTAVPDGMSYQGERQDDLARALDELGFAYTRTAEGIDVRGKATHAMLAEEGINAIARLCIALQAIGIESKAIRFIAELIGEDPFARRVFGDCADEPSGVLKFNVGKIELGELERLSIDARIPVTNIEAGLERERQPVKPTAAQTSTKFINPRPGIAPTYFQDRVVETEQVVKILRDDSQRLMTIVGRGGVGKTAMVCRLLKGLEAGDGCRMGWGR